MTSTWAITGCCRLIKDYPTRLPHHRQSEKADPTYPLCPSKEIEWVGPSSSLLSNDKAFSQGPS